MDELRFCSLTPQNFYETIFVFLPPPPGESSTGMLASRPTRIGVPPRSTTIVDACTPLASAAEGDTINKLQTLCFVYKAVNNLLSKHFDTYSNLHINIHQHNNRQRSSLHFTFYCPNIRANFIKMLGPNFGIHWASVSPVYHLFTFLKTIVFILF